MSYVFKTYLGDGVYADFDGYQIRLTTSNDEIFLEPQCMVALKAYEASLKRVTAEDFKAACERSDSYRLSALEAEGKECET